MRGEDATLDAAIEAIRRHPSVGRVRIDAREPGSVSLTVDVVRCRACEILMRSKAFLVYPVRIERGRMKWLLITDGNPTIGKLTRQLRECGCSVDVERVSGLKAGKVLTERQEEVLRKAFASGFFDFPRKAGSERLAKEFGISVSTLSEIMRAAQRRILAEYLQS